MRFYRAEAMQLQGLKNRRCIEHMQKALPGFAMRPKAAFVGVTYSGTSHLQHTLNASPHVVAFPAIPKADVFTFANEPSYGLLYLPYLVWLYRQGLWWPEDRLLREMLLAAADDLLIGTEGKWSEFDSTVARPVLFDTYGFSGNEMSVEAFHSPWYYDSNVKLIVAMRNPTDVLYAAYRNMCLECHFGRTFEEEMKISRISSILSMPQKPPFWEVFGMLPWQYGRCCFKNMLEMWMEKFPHENIYIIPNTEMDNNRHAVLRGLADMLDIPELSPISDTKQLERAYPTAIDFPQMKEETREILDEFFALYNDGMDELAAKCHVLGDPSTLLKRIPLRHGRMQSGSTVPAFPEESYLASFSDAVAAGDVAGMIRFAEALFVCGSGKARRQAARTLFSLMYAACLPGYACQALALLREADEEEQILRFCTAALGLRVFGRHARGVFWEEQAVALCLKIASGGEADSSEEPEQIFSQIVADEKIFKIEDYSALPDLERQVLVNRPAVLFSPAHKERIRRVILASNGPKEYLARFVPLGPIGSFCETVPLEA